MIRSLFSILFTCLSLSLFSQLKTELRPPMDIPLYLSGNFGELRSDHFHSGIDIKTKSVTGQKVYSIESGYVSRINIQTEGFGKALYINHPGGYTSVYGHLLSYKDEIEEFARNIQYKNESHSIDVYLKPGELPIDKGELIAFSGSSGSSAGPHLHFEIRTAGNQHPLNCLLFKLPIKDNIQPVFKRLAIYPVGANAQVNNSGSKYLLDLTKNGDSFTLNTSRMVRVYGKIGFGVEVYDYMNGSSNRCGIYSLELVIDGNRYYYSEMDEFAFSESRFINAHIDYSLKQEMNYAIQRLYKLPFDNLSIYKYMDHDGYITITDTLIHEVQINTRDSKGNISQLHFNVKGSGNPQKMILKPQFDGTVLPYNAQSGFSDRDIQLTFPAYCFYDDVNFTFARTKGREDLLSDVFHIHNKNIPVHTYFDIYLTPGNIIRGKEDKMCLVMLEEGEVSFAGGAIENGKLHASIRNFGNFAVAIDTLGPEIKPLNFHKGKDYSNLPGMRFYVKDKLSGIDKYNGFIDNQWVLFEYDPKNDLLLYEFDEHVPVSKKNHELEVHLIDVMGNETVLQSSFYR